VYSKSVDSKDSVAEAEWLLCLLYQIAAHKPQYNTEFLTTIHQLRVIFSYAFTFTFYTA